MFEFFVFPVSLHHVSLHHGSAALGIWCPADQLLTNQVRLWQQLSPLSESTAVDSPPLERCFAGWSFETVSFGTSSRLEMIVLIVSLSSL